MIFIFLFLEHSLHQLLRKAHKNNLNPETGGLSSSPVGVSKRRRIAGPRAADRKTLLKMATEETFLEQIIAQAQHVVLRLRAMFVLDQVSQNLRDPLINFHWSTLSSPTRTSVKVSFVALGKPHKCCPIFWVIFNHSLPPNVRFFATDQFLYFYDIVLGRM